MAYTFDIIQLHSLSNKFIITFTIYIVTTSVISFRFMIGLLLLGALFILNFVFFFKDNIIIKIPISLIS